MEDNIYKIITEYCDKEELISKNALKEIFNIYKSERDLSKYVNDLEFVNRPDVLAHYQGKKIEINYERIKELAEFKSNYAINLCLVYTLLHELNHVEHNKKVSEIAAYYNENETILRSHDEIEAMKELFIFESELYLKLGNEGLKRTKLFKRDKSPDLTKKFDELYMKNHDIYPCERFCDLDAINFLKNLVYKYETDYEKFKNYLDLLDAYYNLILVQGYKRDKKGKLTSPSDRFIKTFKCEDAKMPIKLMNKKQKESKQYDTKTLMKLGLDIDRKSYDCIYDYLIYIVGTLDCFKEEQKNRSLRQYK